MPRFTPDMTKARSSVRIFDRGLYMLNVTSAKPFIYERERDGAVVAGVKYGFKMVGKIGNNNELTDEFEGEAVSPNSVYIHTEGAWGMAKGFIMACAGYSSNQEDEFDSEWVPEHDFTLEGDPEDQPEDYEVGDAWTFPVGKNVVAFMDKRMYEGNAQQNVANFSPASDIKG